MALSNPYRRTPGIVVFALFVFILTAVPRMNIKVGPIPIYIIDVILVYALLLVPRKRLFAPRKRPFQTLVILLFIFAILGEVAGILYSGAALEAVYLTGRITLAFSVFYLTGQFIQTPKDLEIVLKAAVSGLLVTASLMILTSLPMTRNTVVSLVFDNGFLEPASSSVAEMYSEMDATGQRGRTLVGVSIVGATFINIVWPLAALLSRWPYRIGVWSGIAFFACLLAPMAVLMSYSRGPILGSVLIILLALVYGLKRIRRGILFPVAVAGIIVATVGVGSSVFFFDRLTDRATAMLNDPLADERESERILAYIEPFEHAISNPIFLVVGEGTAITKTSAVSEQHDKATHALFAKAYYTNGMLAAFLYMLLIVSAIYYAFWHVKRRRPSLGAFYGQALLACMVAMLPLIAFDHTIVSAPRGTMMFFFVLGLLTSLRHFPMQFPRTSKRTFVHRYERPVSA